MKLKKSAEAQWFCDLSADEKTNGIYSSLSFTYLIKSDFFFIHNSFVSFSPCCLFVLLCFVYLFIYFIQWILFLFFVVLFSVHCQTRCLLLYRTVQRYTNTKHILIKLYKWKYSYLPDVFSNFMYVQESKVKGVCVCVWVYQDISNLHSMFLFTFSFFPTICCVHWTLSTFYFEIFASGVFCSLFVSFMYFLHRT